MNWTDQEKNSILNKILENSTRLENGCLIYRNNKDNYGHIWFKNKCWLVHRLVFQIKTNDFFLPYWQVCHKCDTPGCAEFDHLFKGTNYKNTLDRDKKGRYGSRKGELNGRSKITLEIANEIRDQYKTRSFSMDELAVKFQIHQTTISKIIRNKLWALS